jgi:hypothetical protein
MTSADFERSSVITFFPEFLVNPDISRLQILVPESFFLSSTSPKTAAQTVLPSFTLMLMFLRRTLLL